MGYCLGIDLGTTNSVASVFRRGVVETIEIDGRPLLPSAISLKPDGTWLIGAPARARAFVEPDATVVSSKRDIGKPKMRYGLPGKSVTPVDVAAIVLTRIREAASEMLGPVVDAVITVPAYFDDAQRKATKDAGEQAGFRVLRILPEPTAAAIAYGIEKGKDQTILVYDLGGGTFDVSVLKIEGNDFRVLAVGGDGFLGGDDFDEKVVAWILEQSGISLEALPSRQAQAARQRLRQLAEAAKIALAESDSSEIVLLDIGGVSKDLVLTRATYESLVAPLVQRTIDVLHSVLKESELDRDDIDRVILVGGSTKNLIVRRMITEELREPFIAPKVDLVVSHGAAIVGASLSAPDFDPGRPDVHVSDVVAHSLGTDFVKESRVLVDRVIPKQTPYPCKRGRLYSARPFQERVVSGVFRGESEDPAECDLLGQLPMVIRNPGEYSILVGVIFEMDKDGIVHFTCIQMPADEHGMSMLEYANANDNALPVEMLETLLSSNWGYSESVKVSSQI